MSTEFSELREIYMDNVIISFNSGKTFFISFVVQFASQVLSLDEKYCSMGGCDQDLHYYLLPSTTLDFEAQVNRLCKTVNHMLHSF